MTASQPTTAPVDISPEAVEKRIDEMLALARNDFFEEEDGKDVAVQLRALRSALTASGEALKRYGWHGGGSPMCERVKGSDYPCTCGLDAILAKGETK